MQLSKHYKYPIVVNGYLYFYLDVLPMHASVFTNKTPECSYIAHYTRILNMPLSNCTYV